ncbi:MAG: Lrp/AsnC family transcriptional regulator [Oscillospiraceae bacterium]|jgi:DNA-binding Lrp family transcriptional regulator|nr:Lrp/AsnC family transcriptional regulator [Oscillospiraceae bacterium]
MNNELLKLLKKNARYSDEELGAMLGIPASEIAGQIKKLEDDGIIRGYTTVVDGDKLDDDAVCAIIELKVKTKSGLGFNGIVNMIMQFDEVESVALMAGDYDLAVTVRGAKAVAFLVSQRLSTIDDVLSTATHFVLKKYKENGVILNTDENDERGFVSP